MVKLDRCLDSCNTFNDLSNTACAASKIEDLDIRVFNMITWTNEWTALTKYISSECKYKFDEKKNVTFYQPSIMDDSATICDDFRGRRRS